jgi:rubredoxin
LERFDILHTKDFNPNADDWIIFREEVKKEDIGVYLVSLCKLFYTRESEQGLLTRKDENKMSTEHKVVVKKVYQCPECLSIYDETTGEEEAGIPGSTAFEDLPETYCCPLCETGKDAFTETDVENLYY